MKKLRVLALMHEKLVPPEDVTELDVTSVEWKTEFDVVTTLHDLGHEVHTLGVLSDLSVIGRAIEETSPDVAFNLLEEFDGVAVYDQNVVSHLELLRLPYTGCNPRGLMLARDKGLSKKILHYHRIPVPEFTVFPRGRKLRRPKRLTYPVIVKTLAHEGSLGISQASVVEDDEKLFERVTFVHERFGTDAIAEQYIDGRELYVGVVGNQRLQVFPVWELRFENMPEDGHRIATRSAKWNARYQKRVGMATGRAIDLPPGVGERIQRTAKRIYRTLGLSGYARIDLRLAADGRAYFLEANPNPQIAYGEDFAESAEAAGISYEDLLQKLLTLGRQWNPDRLG